MFVSRRKILLKTYERRNQYSLNFRVGPS